MSSAANDVPVNGASYPDFSWGQTCEDLDIKISVPEDVRRGKQIQVKVSGKEFRVACVSCAQPKDLVVGELSYPVKEEDITWTLTPGRYILMQIEKSSATRKLWTRLFTWEKELEKKSMMNEVPLESLAQEEQMKIQELMWKERQKKLVEEGLASKDSLQTSEERKVMNMLREAWDAEGSPFKGKPFDPNVLSQMHIGNSSSSSAFPPDPSS